ncbi:hypothetical protein KIN20_008960 [Parelaphostrongylus tenuis]|uniref:Uncharacterized protein n=1 Tax=Parelaphostrongylus tenuis TaxID=148309 RepID=A0AAD5MX79_PARTN|nr:hypothetical protein KIN20_008960 [Parelaphostrongylus tenuis]
MQRFFSEQFLKFQSCRRSVEAIVGKNSMISYLFPRRFVPIGNCQFEKIDPPKIRYRGNYSLSVFCVLIIYSKACKTELCYQKQEIIEEWKAGADKINKKELHGR